MLRCPYCESTDNVCVSTINRATINGKQRQVNYVWRRRKCSSCGEKFTTHETVSYTHLTLPTNREV